MSVEAQRGPDHLAKVVLAGLPGSGRSTILRSMARRHAHDSVRVGDVAGGAVHRTEFYWPEVLANGRRLRVSLYALSGAPVYNAVSELLLKGCSGIIFVADAQEERLQELREAFRQMVFNLGRAGRDIKRIPAVLQYHHRSPEPGFSVEGMDRYLGLEPGEVSRLTARYPAEGMDPCRGVEEVVRRIAREACPDQIMLES